MQFSIFLFLFLLKFTFSKRNISGTPSDCQTVWDPDQDRQHVGPDLDPNYLQKSQLARKALMDITMRIKMFTGFETRKDSNQQSYIDIFT